MKWTTPYICHTHQTTNVYSNGRQYLIVNECYTYLLNGYVSCIKQTSLFAVTGIGDLSSFASLAANLQNNPEAFNTLSNMMNNISGGASMGGMSGGMGMGKHL